MSKKTAKYDLVPLQANNFGLFTRNTIEIKRIF